jgi:hypothetical protein
MAPSHWSEDELIALAYGVAPREAEHLEGCASCAGRFQAIAARRQALRRAPEVPQALLAAQRRAIEARLARPSGPLRLALVPSLAAVLLVLVGLMVFRPTPERLAPQAGSDSALFEEVFTLAADPAPQAVEPVRSLFEDAQ